MTKIDKDEVEILLRARVKDFNERLEEIAQKGLKFTRVGGGTLDLSVSIAEMRRSLTQLENSLEAADELFTEQWSTYTFELLGKVE